MAEAVKFDAELPDIGYVLTWSDHEYVLKRVAALGEYVELTWAYRCKDCDTPLTIKSNRRKRYLPLRCKTCNGADDKDAMERRAYTSKRFKERMAESRAAAGARVHGATLGRFGMMNFWIVRGDEQSEWGWKPGADMGEEWTPQNEALMPRIEAEYARLTAERDLFT